MPQCRRKFVWFLFLILIPLVMAINESPKRILLINSNASVEKYRIVQEEFKKVLYTPVLEVNLGNEKWTPSQVEALIKDKDPDIIYCIGSKAYFLTTEHSRDRQIVFSSIMNWLRLPISRKTYGVSNELHSGMQIMLFRHVFPQINKIGVLHSKKHNRQWLEKVRSDALDFGVEIVSEAVDSSEDVIPALEKWFPKDKPPRINAFWLISDPVVISDKDHIQEIFQLCEAYKMPVFSYHNLFVKYGAILIVAVDDPTIGRQAASIVIDLISEGKIEQKIQFPVGTHITLNQKKVEDYKLYYNQDALNSINTIIE
ncbi:ABC transporter substrate-binding protein [candidate division CSSED10-310 bacterium]|uniref:ABC transporter substrate-binding protein n=1 Tax=candidate division CSSED10-310 bacterium TaxID=2855610 RepID=A0ABV6Z5Z5_UNCC1